MKSSKVLLVDNEEENHFILESLLKDQGLSCMNSLSGREALDLVFDHDFDAIFLDIMMPGMDGLSVAQFLRNNRQFKNLKIIFVTSVHKDNPMIKEAAKLENVFFLFKPVLEKKLKKILQVLNGPHTKSA